MEATGVYWRPVWHILDGDFELVLANAAHIKNVPGRKTDVNDATWIANLLAHGLIRASFVPPTPVQELRMLTRTRKQLVRERAAHAQRVDKVLQDANVKLGSVLTDIMGVSGRAILAALIAGETDVQKLSALVHGGVKKSRAEIEAAVRGKVGKIHRSLLKVHLGQADTLTAAIAEIDKEVGERLETFRDAHARLIKIPGIGEVAAAAILSEIGVDMQRFPTSGHLVSWATLCPRNDESAGKRRSTRVRPGSPWLKPMLIQCAWAAARTRNSYYQAQYLRLRARRGPKKAIVAVAASMLPLPHAQEQDRVPRPRGQPLRPRSDPGSEPVTAQTWSPGLRGDRDPGTRDGLTAYLCFSLGEADVPRRAKPIYRDRESKDSRSLSAATARRAIGRCRRGPS
jgi:transposase